MAVIIGIIVVLGIVTSIFFGTFAIKAYGISIAPAVEEKQEMTASETQIWGFGDDYNQFDISLPVELSPYGTGGLDIPEVFVKAFDNMSTPVEKAGMTETWVSEDEKKALRLTIYETDEADLISEYGGLEFGKQYSYNTPYIVNYTTVNNGTKIHLDFVLDNKEASEGMAFEQYTDEIISSATMLDISANTKPEYLSSTDSDNKSASGLLNFAIFIFVLGAIFISITITRKISKNASSSDYGTQGRYPYNYKLQKDIAMDYDHCNDEASGMSYSVPKPQEYDRDYQRYAYGIGMSKEDKFKKQDQYKSLLESGMIEQDEYNEKIAEINKLYKK